MLLRSGGGALYAHLEIAIMFDHSRLGLENKFFPKTTKTQ